jgi:hypothetical protein
VSSTPAPPLASAAELDAMPIDPFFETVFRDLILREVARIQAELRAALLNPQEIA